MIYGYFRKESERALCGKKSTLREWNCDLVFFEEAPYNSESKLEKLVNVLTLEDTVIVDSLKIFGKRLHQMSNIFSLFQEKSIRFISISDGIDTSKNSDFYHCYDVIAQMDSYCQSELTKKSLARVRNEGQTLGRPKTSSDVIEEIKNLHYHHHLSIRSIANKCQVSIGTVHKYVSSSR